MRKRWWFGLGLAMVVALAVVVAPATGVGPFNPPCASAQTGAAAGSSFTPRAPQRILDTRFGPGPVGPLTAGAPLTLDLRPYVPANATAVVLNLTGVDASVPNFLEVWPAGTGAPNASNLNLVPNRAMANLVTVALGQGANAGQVSILTNAGSANVVADLAGSYTGGIGGAGYTPRTPLRALDTRTAVGNNQGVVGAGKTITLDLGAVIPPTATAVVGALTATDVTASTFVTAWPTGAGQPNASNVNVLPGTTSANLVTVSTGAGQKINLYNVSGAVDLVFDVAGYFAPGVGGLFVPLSPTRVLDTRYGTGAPVGRVGPGASVTVDVSGVVPATGTAVIANVTGVAPSDYTHLTAWPSGVPRPDSSNVNLAPGDVTPSLAAVRLGTGRFDIANNSGTIDLVADVSGYYVPRPPCGVTSPPAPSFGLRPAMSTAPVAPTTTPPAQTAAVAPSPSPAPAPAGSTSPAATP